MSNLTNAPTVAIITATIGRPSLHRAIKSVQAQSYPCRHYVFVDGEQYHAKTKEILKDYPEVIAIYLPMNTGVNKMYNSYINAIAPFLATEEIICYLDDDNWYDKDHVKYLVSDMVNYQTQYAYSLRYYIDNNEEIICEDNDDALGYWRLKDLFFDIELTIRDKLYTYALKSNLLRTYDYLIDVNSYAINKSLAQALATTWIKKGNGNDIQITKALIEQQITGICTGKRTVYYQADLLTRELLDEKVLEIYPDDLTKQEIYAIKHEHFIKRHQAGRKLVLNQGKVPWEKKTLFKEGQLIALE